MSNSTGHTTQTETLLHRQSLLGSVLGVELHLDIQRDTIERVCLSIRNKILFIKYSCINDRLLHFTWA